MKQHHRKRKRKGSSQELEKMAKNNQTKVNLIQNKEIRMEHK